MTDIDADLLPFQHPQGITDASALILIFESGLRDAIREAPSPLIVSEGHKKLRL